jgi:rhamnosyltransferase subunit B
MPPSARQPARILIACFGSLGDLHPYVALARALAERGAAPVIASVPDYAPIVEAAARGGGLSIGFVPVRPGMAEFGDPAAMMARLFDPRRGPEYLIRDVVMPWVARGYADLADAVGRADLLVTHPLAHGAMLHAERTGLPWVSTVLAPMSLLSCDDPPLVPGAAWLYALRRLGVAPYRAVFGLARRMMRHWEQPLHAFRREAGLPATTRVFGFEGQYSPRLNLAMFPSVLAQPQADWPAATWVTGAARFDGDAPDRPTCERLEAFLAAGEAPLVFALGSSAVWIAGGFWRNAISAARGLGRRAILLTGAEPEALGPLPQGIAAFRYLPYSMVFPRAAAVIHQAGIGTLSQALASGRPQLIVPVAFDQPDNARRTAMLGVARVLPFRRAGAPAMQRELAALLADANASQAAARIATAVRAEDGAGMAARSILALLG